MIQYCYGGEIMQLKLSLIEKADRDNDIFPFYIYQLTAKKNQKVFNVHWHEELEIIYCQSSGILELNSQEYYFEKNDIIFINKENLHKLTALSDGVFFVIVFHYQFLDFKNNDYCQTNIMDHLKKQQLLFPWKIDEKNEIYGEVNHLILEIIELYFSQSIGRTLKIKSNLYHIIFLFLNSNQFINASCETADRCYQIDYVKSTIKYLEENFSDHISINDLSKHSNISKFYLLSIFKQFTGMSPIEYLINLRLENSLILLKENKSVTQTAYDAGFNSVSYYIKKFREKYNQTPKDFKNK